MKKIKLIIAYDGTTFFGWQDNGLYPSVEQVLRECLLKILQQEVILEAASRTDTRVHAEGQVVVFCVEKSNLSLLRLKVSLNQLLPKAVVVTEVREVPLDFHPTLDAEGKEYRYAICRGAVQLPQYRHFSWHIPQILNIEAMRQAALQFIGKQDFTAFCNRRKNLQYEDHIRTIKKCEIEELPENRLRIMLQGDRFLYKMARNIVGTIVYVGRGKIEVKAIPEIIASKKRIEAGITAPAHGLTLHRVFYLEE